MVSKKILVVVGATGTQGTSVANTFLKRNDWQVRAITRDPSSAAAQSLISKGAEVVEADLADPSSLNAAFTNAAAIFLNTTFWPTFDSAKAALQAEKKDIGPASQTAFDAETNLGKNAADAASAVPPLERLVVSTLPSVANGGAYTRPLHPEAKDWIVKYIERKQPALAKRTSLIYLGAYYSNKLLAPTFDTNSGKYLFYSPLYEDAQFPVVDEHNSVGPFVRVLIEDEPAGVKLLAYDSNYTVGQYVNEWSKASGKPAAFVPVTAQQAVQMGGDWEHLDGLGLFNKHRGDCTVFVPELIKPHQLKAKVESRDRAVRDMAATARLGQSSRLSSGNEDDRSKQPP